MLVLSNLQVFVFCRLVFSNSSPQLCSCEVMYHAPPSPHTHTDQLNMRFFRKIYGYFSKKNTNSGYFLVKNIFKNINRKRVRQKFNFFQKFSSISFVWNKPVFIGGSMWVKCDWWVLLITTNCIYLWWKGSEASIRNLLTNMFSLT